jgi:hypothetical protein
MTHSYKPSGSFTTDNVPILYCEKCAHFSNQQQKACTGTPEPLVQHQPIVVERIVGMNQETCPIEGCNSPKKVTCNGNVQNVNSCGKQFCENHTTFIQSIDKQLSSYQCQSCGEKDQNLRRQYDEGRLENRKDQIKTDRVTMSIATICLSICVPVAIPFLWPIAPPCGCCFPYECCYFHSGVWCSNIDSLEDCECVRCANRDRIYHHSKQNIFV